MVDLKRHPVITVRLVPWDKNVKTKLLHEQE